MCAAIRIILLLTAAAEIASAQNKPPPNTDASRLGMTCAQILKMTSTQWITYAGQRAQRAASNNLTDISRATYVYGQCYEARTDALAVSLAKSGKGPSKAARADFAEFDAALKDFTAKAVAHTQPPADAQKRSYAALYEKQFRRRFYERYEPRSTSTAEAARTSATNSATMATQRSPSPSSTSPSSKQAANDTDEISKAKNRFGELLGALADDKLHELHAAFGAILGQHEVDSATRLAVYRYAIFLLEPNSGENPYPPPF